jgi:hypothetical protein
MAGDSLDEKEKCAMVDRMYSTVSTVETLCSMYIYCTVSEK